MIHPLFFHIHPLSLRAIHGAESVEWRGKTETLAALCIFIICTVAMDMFTKANMLIRQTDKLPGEPVTWSTSIARVLLITRHIQVTIELCGGIFWRWIVSSVAAGFCVLTRRVTECSNPPCPRQPSGMLVRFHSCIAVVRNKIVLTSSNHKLLNVR